MTTKVRSPFLPVFLTLLIVAFTVALAVRIRSYRAMGASVRATTTSEGARTSGPQPTDVSSVGSSAAVDSSASGPEVRLQRTEGPRTGAVTREQRSRELLAMGNTPEAAAVKTAVELPETPKVKAVPLAAPPRSVVPQSSASSIKPAYQQPVTQPHTTTSSPDNSRKSEEPKDPNSDTVPPQLISIEFQPPQIRDGEETMLIITATDDLSGIRGISGTLTSPTGKALQGFAQQREGETNRYVSRITIPKDAEEGIWKISFLNLSDLATNMVTLSYAQGTIPPNAVLKVVSSASDKEPPTLRSASISRRAMHSGESNTLFVEADDDKSGVRLVSAVFVSPSKHARLGFACKQGSGATWECALNVPDCLDCGEWQLEQIQMQDKANNYATVRADNPIVAAVRVNIAGNSCDSTPPAVQSLMLDKSVVIMGQGEPVVTIRVTVTDDSCGVGGLSGQVVGPGTNAGTFFAFAPEGGDTNSWVGTFRLSPQAPRGIWRVQSITVNDKGQNLRIYYATDPLLARGQFVVK